MRLSGITFKYIELVVWRDRAINGPYKTTGDRFAFSPGSWDDLVIRSERFMSDPSAEYWDYVDAEFIGDYPGDVYTYSRGHGIVAAAFYGLIKEDNTYREAAKTAVLAQIANSNPVFEDHIADVDYPNGMHFAAFTSRLFYAFDYTYDLWSASEITAFETWMERAMILYRHIWSDYCYRCWPNRDDDDYSVVSWWALTGQETTAQPQPYTHSDLGGTDHNFTAKYANWFQYQNRSMWYVQAEFLWGLYKNDDERIGQVKRYIREMLMFAVWPDGMIAESYANGKYGRVGTGAHWYVTLQISGALMIAEHLRRRGDNSLYEFSTSEGIFGSEGGTKNLRLLVDTHVENLRGEAVHGRYFKDVDGDFGPVNDLYPLDPREPGGSTFRHKSEMCISYANAYWQDNTIKDTYMTLASGCDSYFAGMGGPAYVVDAEWVDLSGGIPAAPMMTYEMEGVNILGNAQGAKSLLI
ncbi:hypothetical protein KAR91_76765 [Candidatus Pacearchaeota archaeon]|nr:hypothetical protein [Candidatus Pacearchaeota archaeon]